MTVKTLSAVAVRIIGWLDNLEGIKSFLSSVLLVMMRVMVSAIVESSRPATSLSYVSVVSAILVGLIELGVGFSLIRKSEFFGQILCKGIKERL
jgi:hypothetical protein